MAIFYENVFKGKRGSLFARNFDSLTKEVKTEKIKSIPSIFIHDSSIKNPEFISIPENKPLKELKFNSMKEYREAFKLYDSTGVPMYGNKSQEQNYIRNHWENPEDCFHEFSNTWYYDIETAVFDDSVPRSTSKNDWKPMGHQRAAMATITSIQIFDKASMTFIILGLKKDWTEKDSFKHHLGPIKYIKCTSEEDLLKKFLQLLRKRDPALLTGWNTKTYDEPFITNRIIRVLDGRDDLYYYSNEHKRWRFNTDCLEGNYVKQLSPHADFIKHREVKTSFGIQDDFSWVGIIQEDYLDLYKKYTFTSHTSYSLDSIAGYELGSEKVNHDEHADFREFYEKDFNKFIEYGIQDTGLIYEIDQKLKLIDLAKYIAYTTGCTMDMIRGTVQQWNSFMFNNHYKKGEILPLEGKFGEIDTVLQKHAVNMDDLSEDRKEFYKRTLSNPSTRGQAFPGGITRGTGKFWKEVFSLDFASLYPSCIQWANIGIDTLIQPKDLPKELLDLRTKYAIFYPKDVSAKDLIKYDYWFSNHIIGNEEVRKEIYSILNKHNVSMTPNGMFFTKNKRSVLSQTMENIIMGRKKDKQKMKEHIKKVQELKSQKQNEPDNKELDDEIKKHQSMADMYNVYQLGKKTLNNSAYGALSMQSTVFAGDTEYFSGAVTSSARNANLIAGQCNSIKIDEVAGTEAKEIQYGEKTYQDNIPQIDTDSNYISIAPVIEKKFGKNYRDETKRSRITEFTENYINKVSLPITYDELHKYSSTLNAYLPEKLQEDAEVICDNFISVAPKMYCSRKWWDEGLYLDEPKLKVTGLSMVRSNTPKFYRKKLEDAISILLDGDIPKIIDFMNEVKSQTDDIPPSDICINQGLTSLDYDWYEDEKKFKRWTGEKWLSAPINSRAGLVHNKYINDNKIMDIKEIEPGDKIGFIELKMPNPTLQNVIAFKNQKLFDYGLLDYIDRHTMYIKGFENNIKLITDPIGWDLTPESEKLDEDEW